MDQGRPGPDKHQVGGTQLRTEIGGRTELKTQVHHGEQEEVMTGLQNIQDTSSELCLFQMAPPPGPPPPGPPVILQALVSLAPL